MADTRRNLSRETLADAADGAIQRAQDWLLAAQYPDGYWWGELETNVC
ncbi:MAG: hypothetical protein ACE5IZ_09935, partial [Dehalococcoidia bacterium]